MAGESSYVVLVTDVDCCRPIVRYHPDLAVLKGMVARGVFRQPGVQALTLFDPRGKIRKSHEGKIVRITTVGGELQRSSTIDQFLGVVEAEREEYA